MEKQIGEILKTDLTDEQKLTLINVIISPKKKEETKSDEIVEKSYDYTKFYKMIDGKKVLHRENGPAVVSIFGDDEYYRNGLLHRDGDLPAFIDYRGKVQRYFKHGVMTREGDKPSEYNYGDIRYTNDKGVLHRENGPAVITADGIENWYFNGKLHRDGVKPAIYNKDMTIVKYYKHGNLHRDGDLPASIENGRTSYYRNGKLHRDGDLPAIICKTGSTYYYKNGKLHRDGDMPAKIEANGTEIYYKDGNIHRDGDKPAVITKNGVKSYYTNDNRTKVEY